MKLNIFPKQSKNFLTHNEKGYFNIFTASRDNAVDSHREAKKFLSSTLKIDENSVKSQLSRLEKIKQTRNSEDVQNSLVKLKSIAKSSDNLMDGILNAVKNYATLGEISDVLRIEFGTQS